MEILKNKKKIISKYKIIEEIDNKKYIKYFIKLILFILQSIFNLLFKRFVIYKHKFLNCCIFRLDEKDVYDFSNFNLFLNSFFEKIDNLKSLSILKLEINDLLIYLEYVLKKNKIRKTKRNEIVKNYKDLFLSLNNKDDILYLKKILLNEIFPYEKKLL